MKNEKKLWYIRRKGQTSGPFVSTVVSNKILLGRLSLHDELSSDQVSWNLILNYPELYAGMSAIAIERAKKNLDERDGFDRRQQTQSDTPAPINRRGERRYPEDEEDIQRRQFRTVLMQKYRLQTEGYFWPIAATISIIFIITILALLFPKQLIVPLPNCSTPAGPNINWNNCLKQKFSLKNMDLSDSEMRNSGLMGSDFMKSILTDTDLSYADLRFTNLSYCQLQRSTLLGANLKQADLSYADLSNADLSYADLKDANLSNSNLTNTRFDHAIWINGQLCASESIGQCVPVIP